MHENLVIVESPAKAKTIEKFLGSEYTVKSSYGHIRDLSKKALGIDINNKFEPHYEVSEDKKKVVSELSKLAKSAKHVWLASDEDREGEAIAWHLTEVLGLPVEQTKRIVFHEITKGAILAAIENPRKVNMDLVNAQQARRVLDRLVGFELSPVLWKKVKPSLSAGRVQSVAVRLIVDRERDIINFKSEEFYKVVAHFYESGSKDKTIFKAELSERLKTEEEAKSFLQSCVSSSFTVAKSECKPASKSPAAPFTTSTLQQEAGRKLGMSVSQTMSVAQKLYENGYITYMRTDSVNLSVQAIASAQEEITKLYGEKYSHSRNFKTKSKGAQEAHEAIRPSYLNKQEIEGTPAEKRLYSLIWKRTVASQMAPAELERRTITIDISGSKSHFVAVGEVILFEGFMKLYMESSEDENGESKDVRLPDIQAGSQLSYKDISAIQRFTQSPARYSEASLVRRLEELGIGRPSTYAPTITTVINRGYVLKQTKDGVKRDYTTLTINAKGDIDSKVSSENIGKEKNKLAPTDIGMVVTDYLQEQFGNIMDFNFTATVEKDFDDIADGKLQWQSMLERFYGDFHGSVEKALETSPQKSNQNRVLGVDPVSGKEVSARIGRYGPMAQIGVNDEDSGEKARFASLRPGQLIESITLEDALALFALPRTVGEVDGKAMVIGIGRFGPYVRFDGKFVSLAKSDDPYTITFERAQQLVEEKQKQIEAAKTPLKTFEEDAEIQVLVGRYGPYISYQGSNYKIPKTTEPTSLSYQDCMDIIAKGPTKKRKK